MRYSIDPRDRIYVKGFGFLSFAKNMDKHLSNKYSTKLLDNAKKSTADALKTASKGVINKTSEATGDLIADKITSKAKKSNQQEETEVYTPKELYNLQKKDSKLLMISD